MSAATALVQEARPASAAPPVHATLRRCACGGVVGAGGECTECRRRRLAPRSLGGSVSPAVAPAVVHDVLSGSGRPLDPGVRADLEPRFRRSFADVRVHTDDRAARSARTVGARAYAVGRDIVFDEGRYAPTTSWGRQLLVHELAHVVQQHGAHGGSASLPVGPRDDAREREARSAAAAVEVGADPPRLAAAPRGLQRDAADAPEADAAPAAPAGPAQAVPAAAAPCTPQPEATLAAFRNAGATSAENCCAVCPRDLGVSPGGQALNGMEMRIEITNPCPGTEYDVTRVRESWVWHRLGGAWTELEHEGPGVNDDHHDDDECLRLRRGRFLYVIDRPGWTVALPAAVGTRWPGNIGVLSDAAATDVVAQDTFAEWVIYRHRGHGIPWTPISSPRFFSWRSVIWLRQDATGWNLDAGASEIRRGFRRAVVTP